MGGDLNKGKRKTARPLSCKRPIHLVLKCKSSWNLRLERKRVNALASKYSKKFGVQIYKKSVQKDHFHLVISISNPHSYKKFIRSLTAALARQLGKGIWKLSPFSRVLSWGRDFKAVMAYVEQNELEALGVILYQVRKNYYDPYLHPL